MSTLRVFTKRRSRRKPLQGEHVRLMAEGGGGTGDGWANSIRTNEAAASFREQTYRVATTLTPSVTQKFIKLGCVVIA